MRRVNWTITENQHQELKRLSKETGLPISELVRRALDLYFSSLNEPRESEQSQAAHQLSTDEAHIDRESEVIP